MLVANLSSTKGSSIEKETTTNGTPPDLPLEIEVQVSRKRST
jgi:hypothetical protein